jgi:glucosyl-3-phosphoglycerate synthase
MFVSGRLKPTASAALWFERRSYAHARFSDVDSLARRKRELGLSVSAVLPAREVATTIGGILDQIRRLNERAPLVDELLVIDAGSRDGTAEVARLAGANVHDESELVPQLGPALGKGDAIWRALAVARGDLVLYLDSDTIDFGPQYVYGMLGPLLADPEVQFVKACYTRPLTAGGSVQVDGGSRVTELTAKPLLNLFYPELTGFAQPLAGEIAASRELLASIPFLTGYAVEIAMLIDVLGVAGLDAMAQVDLGSRTNPNQSLFALGKMAYAVARAFELRLRREGRLQGEAVPEGEYVQAIRAVDGLRLERSAVEVVERPPMRELLAARGRRE